MPLGHPQPSPPPSCPPPPPFPRAGVARSIESDVDNLMRLIRIANILPRGLYVESAVKVNTLLLIQNPVKIAGSSAGPTAHCICIPGSPTAPN